MHLWWFKKGRRGKPVSAQLVLQGEEAKSTDQGVMEKEKKWGGIGKMQTGDMVDRCTGDMVVSLLWLRFSTVVLSQHERMDRGERARGGRGQVLSRRKTSTDTVG